METKPGTGAIEDPEDLVARMGWSVTAMEAFCDRWGVGELALFGSVLRDDFGPDSDIDILVRFRSRPTPGLIGVARMQRELAGLLGRPVDLVHRPAIEKSPNYIRRKAILGSARVIYAV